VAEVEDVLRAVDADTGDGAANGSAGVEQPAPSPRARHGR
jgi:hypothetical protein